MTILKYPSKSTTVFARSNFTDLYNLQRVTEFNRRDFKEYVDRVSFQLPNQHILVGILQQLTIDPDWTVEEVVQNTRFRANSLCTLFKITSINRPGRMHTNGFYCENVREQWVLLDNQKVYNNDTDIDDLRPVVPLYSTVLKRGYKLGLEKSQQVNERFNDFAIMGVDLVELAVGWWLYMKQDRTVDTGIHAYLCKYPLYHATLYHNQLSVINILYEFFVKEQNLDDLIMTYKVTFTTLNEEKLFRSYLLFLTDVLTGRRLKSLEMMIEQLDSVYRLPYFNYVDPLDQGLYQQTAWAFEPGVLKLCAIYLSIANRMKYKTADINTEIDRLYPQMMKRQTNIFEWAFREHVNNLTDEVEILNNFNFR